MKKLLSLILALVMIVTCLAGISFAADPIAEVTTGSNTVKVNDRQELFDALSPTGTSVVKLLKDHTEDSQCIFPVTFTFDLNGFSWNTTKGNAIRIASAGTENTHSVVKNGTIDAYILGVRMDPKAGTVSVEDCTIVSQTSCAVALYDDDTTITEKNVINNCVLVSVGGNGAFSWNSDGTTEGYPVQKNMNVTISNTKMVQPQTGKNVFYCRDASAAENANTVTLGENVEVYTADEAALCIKSVKLAGKELAAAESTAIEVLGVKYEGLKKFVTTAAAPAAPVQPETPAAPAPAAEAIAKVVTGDKTVEVKNLEELAAAISPRGTSVVTLLKDITADAMTSVPVCTIDLNGKTWKTTSGNVIAITDELTDDDAENFYSVIKNGTVQGAMSAIRHEFGGLKVVDCTLWSDGANSIQILESAGEGKYNEGNIIENSTLICTITGPLGYNRKNVDFSKISYKIENTNLIASKAEGTIVFGKASGTTSGTFVLGKDVKIYTYKTGDTGYLASDVPVTGEALTKAEATQTVEVLGQSFAGLFMWSTAASQPAAPVQPETPAQPAQPETPAQPAQPETPAAPVQPEAPVQPVTPSVPSTNVPDVEVPKTGASVMALGIMAMVSLAGAVISKKN